MANHPPIFTGGVTSENLTELTGVTGNATVDQVTGVLTFTDADLTDKHSVTVKAGGTGYVGTLTAVVGTDSTGSGSGSVTWTFQAKDSALDFLAAGQTITQTYTITISDGHGGTALQNVAVTLVGTNDAPVIVAGGTTAGPVTELAGVAA